MHYDVIIIGAGLSGISAGIRLAHYGKKVAVFERHRLPGGLNSYYTRHGQNVDVGLHAMTNYVPEGMRSSPLNKILRQLRIKREAWQLCPQTYSLISFPGAEMRMDNSLDSFKNQVAQKFHEDSEGFSVLCNKINSLDLSPSDLGKKSTRQVLDSLISSRTLKEMLLCPAMFYGNPCEDDMDFSQFSILFQSLFVEGMARPKYGMKAVISCLLQKFADLGGNLILGNGVHSLECIDSHVTSLTDDRGKTHTADIFISCAGARETADLCNSAMPDLSRTPTGTMAFTETIFNLDRHPNTLGLDACIIFRNATDVFRFHPPQTGIDLDSQVICMPGNYTGCHDIDAANSVRMTSLTSWNWWNSLSKEQYAQAKEDAVKAQLIILDKIAPGTSSTVQSWEMFTPLTIKRFTGHINGAIYGSPEKNWAGTTDCDNLFLCGTDQGYLGIVGSLMSGTLIANKYALK